jgi:hypothetical protein
VTSFSDYVQKQAIDPVELPIVHTTEYFRLASIQAANALEATACKIFKEPLLYFFYGRPAYRDASRITPARDVGFYPICFVLRAGAVCKNAKRLYPFDTGASQAGLYEPAVKRGDALTNYPVLAAVESARRIVRCFFETDERYLSGEPRVGLSFSSSEEDAHSYYRLITGGGHPDCDDRSSAVEVQLAETVELRDSVMAIVLPTCFLEDDALAKTILQTWRAQPLTYDADKGMRPLEFHGIVRYLIRDFYRRSGLL